MPKDSKVNGIKSLNFIPSQSRTMSHARKKLKDLNKQKRELNQNDYFFFTCGKWCGTKESILEWLFKGTSTCMWLEQHVCDSFQFSHYEWQRLIAVIVIMLSPIWHRICDSLLIGCIIKLSVFKNISHSFDALKFSDRIAVSNLVVTDSIIYLNRL